MGMLPATARLTSHERRVLQSLKEAGVITSESDGMRRGVQLLEEKYRHLIEAPA